MLPASGNSAPAHVTERKSNFLYPDASHRGQASIDRLQGRWNNLVLVHTPVHASWLNQIEIYFSILQRKVLTPNDFPSTADVEARILNFQNDYEQIAPSLSA